MQHELTDKLRGARGKEWGRLVKRIYYAIGPSLAADGRRQRETGSFKAQDIADLAVAYGLLFKVTCEYLEELPRDVDAPLSAVERTRTGIHSDSILPAGTYASLKESGIKVSDYMPLQRW